MIFSLFQEQSLNKTAQCKAMTGNQSSYQSSTISQVILIALADILYPWIASWEMGIMVANDRPQFGWSWKRIS